MSPATATSTLDRPAPADGPAGPRGPLLIVLSAPSGGGKTTLCQQLLANNAGMSRAITCTTRAPRTGERPGVDYYYLDEAGFRERVQAGDFLEHAVVYGFHYGTLKAEVRDRLRQGLDVLLAIDVQGAASVRAEAARNPELQQSLVTIFLTPPSLAVLEERLRRRAQDSPAVIERRLAVARQELTHWADFDYLLLSESIESDSRRAQAIITAERLRTTRAQPPQF